MLTTTGLTDVSAPSIIFVFILFLLIGGLLSLARKPRHELVTVASGTAWYVYSAMATAGTIVLCGVAVGVKVIVGFFDLGLGGYETTSATSSLCSDTTFGGTSDFCNSISSQASDAAGQARELDLIFALLLIGVGAIIFVIHWRAAKGLKKLFAGSPEWRTWATPLLTTLFYGILGLVATFAVLNAVIQNLVIDQQGSPHSFGIGLGLAVAFTPAWAVLLVRLYRASWKFTGTNGQPVALRPISLWGANGPSTSLAPSTTPPPPDAPPPGPPQPSRMG